jgi:hypothetical protein
LPLSLLWNTGPRLVANGNHYGRWIPTLLERKNLHEVPIMRFDANSNLNFRSTDTIEKHRPHFFLIKAVLPISDTQVVFTTAGNVQWCVSFHRLEDDQLDFARFNYTGFVVDRISGRMKPALAEACCLRLVSYPSKNNYEAIYDCPCTAERMEQRSTRTIEGGWNFQKAEEPNEWSICMLSDPDPQYRLPEICRNPRK